jgi:glycosyltransferase involved in cell wall biosynthesis
MYSNVFFIPHFNIIGGIETYAYELAKKYGKYDITFIYTDDTSDRKQIARLRKLVRVKKYNKEDGIIECKRLFVMYKANLDIFKAEKIYLISHADYEIQNLKPIVDDRIDKYFGVSKSVADAYKKVSGKDTEVIYNPITIEKPRKILKLISATRLSKEKGGYRMIQLAEALDKAEIPYIWYVFTNGKLPFDNPNIVYMKPRLDIRNWINECDYLVQLSNTEAWCYSVLESLLLHTPVITTPIPSFIEMGIKDGENGYILPFEMKDIDAEKIYNNIPKIKEFVAPEDRYSELILKKKSTYEYEEVLVKALKNFFDIEEDKHRAKDSIFKAEKERADYLEWRGLCKLL